MASFTVSRQAIRSLVGKRAVATISAKRVVAPAFRAFPAVASSRTFTSSMARFGSGEKDQALANALAQEQEYEDETSTVDSKGLIEKLGDGKTWEVSDVPGGDIVTVQRKFGDESIKITFRVSDWADISPEDAEEGMSEEETEELSTLPITILISKSSAPGAMYIEADAGRNGIAATNVTIHEKAVAERQGAEGDHERSNSYAGPHQHELDEDLQGAFNAFFEERGLDEALGNFIVSYAELKEQKDYVNWLNQVKGFVQA